MAVIGRGSSRATNPKSGAAVDGSARISFDRLVPGCPRSAMRLNRKSHSGWAAVRRERAPILVVSVACALGATTSAALILSLGDFPIMQTGVPPVAAPGIVRNVSTWEPTKTAQDRAVAESPLPSAAPSMASGRDEPVAHSEVPHQRELPSQQRHRHQRVHGTHARRFANGSWRVTHFNSWRDELTSGAR